MIKSRKWMGAFLALILSSTGYAQQFDVINVGPQQQGLSRDMQSPQSTGQVPNLNGKSAIAEPPAGAQKASPPPGRESNIRGDSRELVSGAPAPSSAPSPFEKYVSIKTRPSGEAMGLDARQFGYDLFSRPPSTFAPVEQVPVGPDYVIGPDDEIRISVWGKVEGQWLVRVDRDGNINVPKIGTLGVTGLTFRELRELLQREFSKYFTGYEMSVSMGSLRTIRVYIVGNAEKPGSYTVSSLATLVNALLEAGGPSRIGTMRNIQLNRRGKTVVSFDMYDLLLKGDKTKDVRLMPEDVIFVPSVGPLVALKGNVKNPAIYEMKGETRLADLLAMAGGLTGVAFKGRIQVQRTVGQESRIVFESDLIDIEKSEDKNFLLKDWDLVTVFNVPESNMIARITGAVATTGEFAIVPGVTRVSDVIAKSGGLLYYASEAAEITRVKVTQGGPVTERFIIDLPKALAGDPGHNVLLEMNDYLFVRAVPDWQLYRLVTISGEIKYPGAYSVRRGERLSSLIERAGGYSEKAYLRGAVFTRDRVRELQQKTLEEMILRLERELLAQSATVAASTTEGIEARKIELVQKQAFIESLKKQKVTGRMTIRLAHLRLLKGSAYDIELEQNDTLFIPPENRVINVAGAVMSSSSVVYVENVTPKEYIGMAGGYTQHADTKNIYLLKVDGSAQKIPGGTVNWSSSKDRWELAGFGSERKQIEPGDTIVVPEKLERVAWLREIKDITQILANMAVTAGAIYLFGNN